MMMATEAATEAVAREEDSEVTAVTVDPVEAVDVETVDPVETEETVEAVEAAVDSEETETVKMVTAMVAMATDQRTSDFLIMSQRTTGTDPSKCAVFHTLSDKGRSEISSVISEWLIEISSLT